MKDREVTETNHARLARESRDRQRGELPEASPGSVAEAFGYLGAEPKGDQRPGTEDRAAFHEERRTGIGGADIATIMDLGFADDSLYRLWALKVGLITPEDDEGNELFRFGHRMEPVLRDWFMAETGLYVAHMQESRVHPTIPWARCTIDGEVYEGPMRPGDGSELEPVPLGGFEAKTAGSFGWKADDPIPLGYQAQAQWSMLVCGWERMWFSVLHGHAFRVYVIEADPADQALLVERGGVFWNDHVLTLEPPPIDASPATTHALSKAYPGAHEPLTAWLPDAADVLGLLREALEVQRQWTKTVALYKNQLKEEMGNADAADFGNGIEVTWTRSTRSSVDTKALKAAYPDVYLACLREAPSDRFTVHGAQEVDD